MPTDGFLGFVEVQENPILLELFELLPWVLCLGKRKSSKNSLEALFSLADITVSVDLWGIILWH